MIGWDNEWANEWAGHAERWVCVGLLCSTLLSITWAARYMSIILATVAFLKDIMLAMEICKCCPEFIRCYRQRLVGKSCDGLLSAHDQCEPKWLDTTTGPTSCSLLQTKQKRHTAMKCSSMYTGKSVATFSDITSFKFSQKVIFIASSSVLLASKQMLACWLAS